ncbi:hypothetical protein HNQ91_002418 [Filimonas zeae]|uniref:Uncharacterized protein n=1 Tax=Filimonas zeae TaxID=1737353 RepID=A0A917IWR2_9BACT|nr:hypothetical protein [Filimonas zeae]MDR6339367.1 hypothetical protein [Filimonas zeae]GGH63916.1 hypothetical protein GCM10011379_15370 [Filimonas zeae]
MKKWVLLLLIAAGTMPACKKKSVSGRSGVVNINSPALYIPAEGSSFLIQVQAEGAWQWVALPKDLMDKDLKFE